MLRAWCTACQQGQHAYHRDVPECSCRGECRTAVSTMRARMEIAELAKAVTDIASDC